jgi:muramidase (phage lysozyme)
MAWNEAPLVGNPDLNLSAFLNFLGKAEGADYNTIVGGNQFDDFSKHPNVVGLTTKEGPSTAAGRYQITGTTYRDLAPKLGITDFSPESQDKIAIALIERANALEDIKSGNYDAAIQKLGPTWASLPSSPYSQPKKDESWVRKALEESINAVIPPAFAAQGGQMANNAWMSAPVIEEEGVPNTQGASSWMSAPILEEDPNLTQVNSSITPQAPPQAPRTITDEAFNTDPTWINNAKTLFKEVEGSDFKGNDADAADWLKNYVAQTDWSLTGAGTTFYDVANKLSPQGQQALLQSLKEYKEAPNSIESVGRAVKGLIFDPANVVGLGAGTLLTKTLGKKALSKGLQEALKQGIAKGAGTKVGSALTSQGAKVAAGGAGVAGIDEGLRQGIQVGAGGQEEYDIGGIATSAGLGAASGLGASKLINRLTGRTDVSKFGARAGSEKTAQLDAEIAQDYQKLSENPIFKISGDEDASKIQTELKNELKKAYVKDVENALRVVDPKLLKQIDVKNILSKTKTAAPDQLAQISTSPEGKVLANAIEKYQRATALTAPSPANQGVGAKLKRAGLQYAPKITAGIIGASTLGPLGFLLGPLAQGVSAGTAQGLTGKKTVPEVIQALSSGRGLKAAQNVSEMLGPSDASITAEKLLERTRRAQQSQAAKAAAQQQAQSQSTLPSVLKDVAEIRQGVGLKGRPVSGAYTEVLDRTGLTNEQAIPILRKFSKDFKGKPIGKAAKSVLQSSNIKDENAFYALQDLVKDVAKQRGILSPQAGALSPVNEIQKLASYAATVKNAELARDIAIKAAPNDQLAQFATTITSIKTPKAKKEALDLAISQVTDAAERDFLVKYIEPLTKFGKKAK